MKLIFIRHGQTDLNLEQRHQGREGKPLNSTGIKQAEKLYDKFKEKGIKIDKCFSSNQERTIQTGQISCKKKPITSDLINVYDLGDAEGISKHDLNIEDLIKGKINNAEKIEDYRARVYKFMDWLIEKYKNTNLTIAIIGHTCTSVAVQAYLNNEDFTVEIYKKYKMPNGSYKMYEINPLIKDAFEYC